MNYLKSIILVAGIMVWTPSQGGVVTITFGEASQDFGNKGPKVESGYRYESFGASWQLIGLDTWQHGGDGCALFTFFGIFPEVGNVTTFQNLDATPFMFQSVELRGRFEGQRNSVIVAHGLLDGIEVTSQILQSSNETWRVEFTNPSFLTPIDELRLEVVEINGAALMLDNFVFVAVPEPNSCVLLALGLATFKWIRVRRVR